MHIRFWFVFRNVLMNFSNFHYEMTLFVSITPLSLKSALPDIKMATQVSFAYCLPVVSFSILLLSS